MDILIMGLAVLLTTDIIVNLYVMRYIKKYWKPKPQEVLEDADWDYVANLATDRFMTSLKHDPLLINKYSKDVIKSNTPKRLSNRVNDKSKKGK